MLKQLMNMQKTYLRRGRDRQVLKIYQLKIRKDFYWSVWIKIIFILTTARLIMRSMGERER
ncbi:MAG: hypothetical protein KIIPBIDF_01334 [Candidatus Methanoperedenaceae archaeon GB50]|nr:MAG: hypothetical protein KIIPBIDF_01334 [Candidatus Methanoperedenaceae archaeon GB50]